MGLDADKIKLEIKDGGKGLQKDIMDFLNGFKMSFDSVTSAGDSITEELYPFNVEEIKNKYAGSEPQNMVYAPKETNDINQRPNHIKYSGTEAIIESVAEKITDALVDKLVDSILNNLEITVPSESFITDVTGQATGILNSSPVICDKK